MTRAVANPRKPAMLIVSAQRMWKQKQLKMHKRGSSQQEKKAKVPRVLHIDDLVGFGLDLGLLLAAHAGKEAGLRFPHHNRLAHVGLYGDVAQQALLAAMFAVEPGEENDGGDPHQNLADAT
mmetsp:Transcript_10964/g.28975  ORF Transcript_10964/g.28975 Transcript_10964/m.28975 type:complete len:122 (-) Transcript_10964:374-739(-)